MTALRHSPDEVTFPDILVPTFPVPAARVKAWADSLTPAHLAALGLQRVEAALPGEITREYARSRGVDLSKHECGCEFCCRSSVLCPATQSSIALELLEPNPHLAPERVEHVRRWLLSCARRAEESGTHDPDAATMIAIIEHYEATKGGG